VNNFDAGAALNSLNKQAANKNRKLREIENKKAAGEAKRLERARDRPVNNFDAGAALNNLNKRKMINNPLFNFKNNFKVSNNPLFNDTVRLGGRAFEQSRPKASNVRGKNIKMPRRIAWGEAVQAIKTDKVMNAVRNASKIARNKKELEASSGSERVQLARKQASNSGKNKGKAKESAAGLLSTGKTQKEKNNERAKKLGISKKKARQRRPKPK
jgi:hypothetical protein